MGVEKNFIVLTAKLFYLKTYTTIQNLDGRKARFTNIGGRRNMDIKMKSKIITIQFILAQVEGEMPTKFTKAEKKNLGGLCKFVLDWDMGADNPIDESLVERCEVCCDENARMYFGKGLIEGFPSFIIRFFLKKKVEKEYFHKMVWMSTVNVCSELGEDTAYFEDHNGNVSIISDDSYLGEFKGLSLEQLKNGITIDKLQSV